LCPSGVQEAPLLRSAAQGAIKLMHTEQGQEHQMHYVLSWHALAPITHMLLFKVCFLLLMAH
jgi:hypothetical protein